MDKKDKILKFAPREESCEELDAFVDSVRDEVLFDELRAKSVPNTLRLEQFQFAYATMVYLTKGTGMTLSYELGESFKTMGSISVEGETLTFDKPEWFARVAEFADNTEVYALVDNKVRLTFDFHGLFS